MRTILQAPAAKLPQAVLRGRGSACVAGELSKIASIPTLAAVSPNLVMGPWINAKGSP